MRKLLIVALLTAACSPLPPTPYKTYNVNITVEGVAFPYTVFTPRPPEQLQKDVALCADYIHTKGIESFKGCLVEQGYEVTAAIMK